MHFKNIKSTKTSQCILLCMSAICTVSILLWVLWACGRGIDFADEGLYIVSIATPEKYKFSATLFGFFYHPAYLLLNGSIAALRQVNAVATFLLSWLAICLIWKNAFSVSVNSIERYVASAALAVSCLAFLRLWLPTPSYNWLALQGILVCLIGLLMAEKDFSRRVLAGWLLIGVGGWIAFLAKPTTAVALGVVALLYLLGSRKFSVRGLLLSVFVLTCLLAATALVIDGSINLFITRLKDGAAMASLLSPDYSMSKIFRVDSFQMDNRSKLVIVFSAVAFAIASYFAALKHATATRVSFLFSIVVAGFVMAIVLGFRTKTLSAGEPFQPLLMWITPLATILAGWFIYGIEGVKAINRQQVALFLLLVFLPYVFAFGTGNNYWFLGGLVSMFWVFAGVIFLSPIKGGATLLAALLPIAFSAQLITAFQILSGVEGPYYQSAPLRANTQPVQLGQRQASLYLNEKFAGYINTAMRTAQEANFVGGTPMIDMTGHSPGVLYALGAVNTGQAWLYGNFPGTPGGGDRVASKLLGEVHCEEAARAWILAEPSGPVKLSDSVLGSFGADLQTDFEIVGTFKTEPYIGGFRDIQVQKILKPTRASKQAVDACAASRLLKK